MQVGGDGLHGECLVEVVDGPSLTCADTHELVPTLESLLYCP